MQCRLSDYAACAVGKLENLNDLQYIIWGTGRNIIGQSYGCVALSPTNGWFGKQRDAPGVRKAFFQNFLFNFALMGTAGELKL